MQNNPNNKKNTIKTIVISIVVLAIVVGIITGGVVYLKKNKDKLEWNLITFPWEKKGFMWPWEQGNYTKEEEYAKEVEEETVVVSGLTKPDFDEEKEINTSYGILSVESLELDNKGFEIEFKYKDKENDNDEPVSIDIEKILVDDLDFQLDKMTINKNSSQTLQISRPNFELYNKNGFKELKIFYKEYNSKGEQYIGTEEIGFFSRIEPTTNIGKKIRIDKKKTVSGTINIYYWKKITDSDNTYLYFYVENGTGQTSLSVKKLLLDDKLYEYTNLKEDFYPNSKRGFSLKIPKKDIKKIKKMEITFFITTEPHDAYGEGVYLTNEYTIDIKD